MTWNIGDKIITQCPITRINHETFEVEEVGPEGMVGEILKITEAVIPGGKQLIAVCVKFEGVDDPMFFTEVENILALA